MEQVVEVVLVGVEEVMQVPVELCAGGSFVGLGEEIWPTGDTFFFGRDALYTC